MARPTSKWKTTLQIGLRTHFNTHPDVHTFLYTLNEGDVGAALRDIIRAHIQQTQHRAGDPGFQKEVAMRGMSQLLDDTIAAALPTETPPPAPLREGAETPAALTGTLTPTSSLAATKAGGTGQPSDAAAGAPANASTAAPEEPPPPLTQEPPPAPATRKPGLVSRFDDD